jgi:hypothetical protein
VPRNGGDSVRTARRSRGECAAGVELACVNRPLVPPMRLCVCARARARERVRVVERDRVRRVLTESWQDSHVSLLVTMSVTMLSANVD